MAPVPSRVDRTTHPPDEALARSRVSHALKVAPQDSASSSLQTVLLTRLVEGGFGWWHREQTRLARIGCPQFVPDLAVLAFSVWQLVHLTVDALLREVSAVPPPRTQKPTFSGRFHYWLPAIQVTSYGWRFNAPCSMACTFDTFPTIVSAERRRPKRATFSPNGGPNTNPRYP